MSDRTALGDRMKKLERSTDTTAMPGVPLLARLDGRAFHSWCAGLEKPYDIRLSRLMESTTKLLVDQFDALVGYTQSDEISLLWFQSNPKAELPFGGRVLKLCSILAAAASSHFNQEVRHYIREKRDRLAQFDCRAWSVPSKEEAANCFLWRERDCARNSVAMAAQSRFSHKQLFGKNTIDMHELLHSVSVNWNDYPSGFKRGSWFRRRVVDRPFTADEIDNLPEKHEARSNPALLVKRHVVERLDLPPFSKLTNKVEFLFDRAEPESAGRFVDGRFEDSVAAEAANIDTMED